MRRIASASKLCSARPSYLIKEPCLSKRETTSCRMWLDKVQGGLHCLLVVLCKYRAEVLHGDLWGRGAAQKQKIAHETQGDAGQCNLELLKMIKTARIQGCKRSGLKKCKQRATDTRVSTLGKGRSMLVVGVKELVAGSKRATFFGLRTVL